jgi:hypothetical protein
MVLELYREQIKKLYPEITDDELNKMVDEYITEALKQAGICRENELNGTYRASSINGVKYDMYIERLRQEREAKAV